MLLVWRRLKIGQEKCDSNLLAAVAQIFCIIIQIIQASARRAALFGLLSVKNVFHNKGFNSETSSAAISDKSDRGDGKKKKTCDIS